MHTKIVSAGLIGLLAFGTLVLVPGVADASFTCVGVDATVSVGDTTVGTGPVSVPCPGDNTWIQCRDGVRAETLSYLLYHKDVGCLLP